MSANTIWRRMTPKKIMEGVFAVHKPTGISSAQALRDLQHHFNPSELFAPWLEAERAARDRESHNQRKRRKDKRIQVKIGHGGTLDPLATGVLIAGIGKGTKSLQDFLLCTKVYEAVVLFGTDTDTYDRVGKVLKRAPYDHITKEMVEEALEQFRGKFMQLPPLFSALKMNGKPLYEYAREGKEIPREIERREVEVLNLELVEWMEGGTHSHVAPTDEAGHAEINVANMLWKQEDVQPGTLKGKAKEKGGKARAPPLNTQNSVEGADATQISTSEKNEEVDGVRMGLDKPESKDLQTPSVAGAKASSSDSEVKPDPEAQEAGVLPEEDVGGRETRELDATKQGEGEAVSALPEEGTDQPSLAKESTPTTTPTATNEEEATARENFEQKKRKLSEDQDDLILERPPTKSRKAAPPSSAETAMMSGGLPSPSEDPAPQPSIETCPAAEEESKDKGPPAVRLRMTVTSGFYVRSLCHDLGAALGSAALMAELERTRQGEFELGKNVLEWEDLGKGEEVWGPRVEKVLDEWHEKNKTDSSAEVARSS
ncbi:pseudouridine synthase [Leptodontidium sp. 2 PMI_412]|nr:pseudouridine synthase [Leptodontidium sp. 2 PMI_412]